MAHTYASLEEAMNFARDEGYAELWGAASTNRSRALSFLESASRRVEDWCQRSAFGSGFGPRIGTNRYDGNGDVELSLRDDLLTATTVTRRPSTAASGTTLVADTDYYLVNQRSQYEPGPYRRVVLHGQGQATFGTGLRVTEILGVWGHQNVTVVLTPTAAEAIDISETEIDVSGLTGSVTGLGLSPGLTLLVDTEQMYVTATTDAVTDSITVVRAANGSTAATHNTAVALARYVYDSRVVDATCRIWLKRWRSRDAGGDGGDGGGDIGATFPRESEDTILRRSVGELRIGARVAS